MNKINPYAKAIVGALAATVGSLLSTSQAEVTMGQGLTIADYLRSLMVGLGILYTVWQVANTPGMPAPPHPVAPPSIKRTALPNVPAAGSTP